MITYHFIKNKKLYEKKELLFNYEDDDIIVYKDTMNKQSINLKKYLKTVTNKYKDFRHFSAILYIDINKSQIEFFAWESFYTPQVILNLFQDKKYIKQYQKIKNVNEQINGIFCLPLMFDSYSIQFEIRFPLFELSKIYDFEKILNITNFELNASTKGYPIKY